MGTSRGGRVGTSDKTGITPAALARTNSTAGDPLVAADQAASGANSISKSANDASAKASSLDGGDLLGSGPRCRPGTSTG